MTDNIDVTPIDDKELAEDLKAKIILADTVKQKFIQDFIAKGKDLPEANVKFPRMKKDAFITFT